MGELERLLFWGLLCMARFYLHRAAPFADVLTTQQRTQFAAVRVTLRNLSLAVKPAGAVDGRDTGD